MAIPAINLIYIWYGHWTTQPNPFSRYHHSVWYWLNRLVALILVLPSVLRSAGLGFFHSNLKDSLSSRGQDQARTVKIRKKLHEHTPQKIWMMSHCAFHPITNQLGLFEADGTPIRWFVWCNVSWESHSFLMLWSPPNPHWAPKVPTSKSREEKSREMRLTAAVKTSMVA